MQTKTDILSILRDFHKISGFRISLHNVDFKEICCYPSEISPFCKYIQSNPVFENSCFKNDTAAFERARIEGKAYIYKCDCGLYEAVAPIYHYGELSGYLMMGQVRDNAEKSLENIRESCAEISANTVIDEELLLKISAVDADKIKSYLNLLILLAQNMTLNNDVEPSKEPLEDRVKQFLDSNYYRKITLSEMTEKFSCSKSSIMNRFKEKFTQTPMDYLNEIRIKKAEELVRVSVRQFKDVAFSCGFSDQNYFSRVFSEKFGVSPSEYRKKFKSGVMD